jgi:hypothetical protein
MAQGGFVGARILCRRTDARGQHPTEHRVGLELADHLAAGQAMAGQGDHLAEQGRRGHLARHQAQDALDDDGQRSDGAQDQRPDRPASGLYDRKQGDPPMRAEDRKSVV